MVAGASYLPFRTMAEPLFALLRCPKFIAAWSADKFWPLRHNSPRCISHRERLAVVLREPVDRNREHSSQHKKKTTQIGWFHFVVAGARCELSQNAIYCGVSFKENCNWLQYDCNRNIFFKMQIFFSKSIDKYTLNVYNNKCKEVDMKKRDLEKLLKQNGWRFLRSGANHDVFTNGKEIEQLPRHREINEQLAKAIIKRRGLK